MLRQKTFNALVGHLTMREHICTSCLHCCIMQYLDKQYLLWNVCFSYEISNTVGAPIKNQSLRPNPHIIKVLCIFSTHSIYFTSYTWSSVLIVLSSSSAPTRCSVDVLQILKTSINCRPLVHSKLWLSVMGGLIVGSNGADKLLQDKQIEARWSGKTTSVQKHGRNSQTGHM